jgi:hypothetical protein
MLTHFLQVDKEVGQSKHILIKTGNVRKANHLEKGFFFLMTHNVFFKLQHHSPQTERVEIPMGFRKRLDHDV